MSGAKETPRQKMIGMMYLVYTALLAMNVSAEILDAFAVVSEGQQKTNASIEVKINDQYNAFQDQYNKDQAKTEIYWEKAQDIRSKTDEMINYIEKDIKLAMVMYAEKAKSEEQLFNTKDPKKAIIINKAKADPKNRRVFYDVDVINMKAKDNTEVPQTMMENEGKAIELKQKLNDYRNYIINTMESVGVHGYSSHVGLLTDYDQNGEKIIYRNANGAEVAWEEKNFYHICVAAEMAVINKIVGEVQTTEFDAVAAMMNRIGATDFKFNKLQARVIAERDYILQGEDYEAEVFLVASDTTRNFRAYYALGKGNQVETTSEGGVIKLKFKGNTLGEQTYRGVVKMINPETGEEDDYDFEKTFTVAQPSATIAATKMNVMYSGLENPISISAPGYTPDEINVRVTGGTLKTINKTKGEYEIVPTNVKEEVHIYATVVKDGKSTTLCDKPYRVKPVPDPIATIGGKVGEISKTDILAAGKLEATMKDFDFDVSYKVLSYRYSKGGMLTNKVGAEFDNEVKGDVRAAKRGDRFFFSDIVVQKPDGTTTNLGNIFITVK